jgi:hypothetical protein
MHKYVFAASPVGKVLLEGTAGGSTCTSAAISLVVATRTSLLLVVQLKHN